MEDTKTTAAVADIDEALTLVLTAGPNSAWSGSSEVARTLASEVERLRKVEEAGRQYVEAVDRGRDQGIGNLGKPILQFQRLRAALNIGPFLGDAR